LRLEATELRRRHLFGDRNGRKRQSSEDILADAILTPAFKRTE
jgi:hypothetical protein